MRKTSILTVHVLFLWYVLSAAHGQADYEKKLDISLSKQEFVLTESIMVSATASNPTDKKVFAYDPGSLGAGGLNFIVTYEGKERLQYIGSRSSVIGLVEIGLKPGESKTVEYDLCRRFKMDRPGMYTIQALWNPREIVREIDGKTVWAKSDGDPLCEPMEFKVLPLNIVYEKKETRRVWALRERHQGLGSRQTLDIFVHESDEGNLKLFAKVSVLSTFFCKYVGDVAQGVTPQGLYDDDGYVHVLFQRPDGIYEYKKLHKYAGKVLAREEIHGPARLQRTANGDVELIRG